MSSPGIERFSLPETMTWEELRQLPEEIAAHIELWNGRVVQLSREPGEPPAAMSALTSALMRCADEQPQSGWRVAPETKVFFGETGMSDFASPGFLVHRPVDATCRDIRASNVSLIGEILPPPHSGPDRYDRQERYAEAGITWHWEVRLDRRNSGIATIRAYALETTPGQLPPGVHPLHTANYLLIGEWSPKDSGAVAIGFPFPIRIHWSELAC